MPKQNFNNSIFKHGLEKRAHDTLNLNDNSTSVEVLLRSYLYYWPYFVAGVLISIFVAFVYLQFADPVYEVKASLIIQDEKKQTSDKSQLQELDLSSSSKLVENEILVLKSRNLIAKMVNDLQLWIGYHKQEKWNKKDLYKSSPVTLQLLSPPNFQNELILKIKIKDKNSFLLVRANGKMQEFPYKSNLKSGFGSWYLKANGNLGDFFGSTILISLQDANKMAKQYQSSIDAVLLNKTAPTVGLSIEDNIEQRGKDILNHLIGIYNKSNILDKNRVNQSTLDFIDKRIVSLAVELNSSEKQVESFRSSRGLTDISSQSKVYLENVQSNDSRLNEVNINLNVIEGIDRYIQSPENSKNLPITLGISDPSLNNSIETLAQLQLQRERLLATTPESNPAFEPIDRQIKTAKASIKESIQNIKASLLSTRNQLHSFESKYELSLRSIPGQERELINKTRQQAIKQNLYVYLLQKREELSLNYASTLMEARVVDSAYADLKNASGKSVTYGLAFLLGLLVPAGVIYGRNSLSKNITKSSQIRNIITAPIIAELSHVKHADPIIIQNDNFAGIGEQFRSLRTNVYYLHSSKQKGRVTLITSSVSGEGKSFISTNLAVSLATAKRKTILVELDLRKPKVSKIFNFPDGCMGVSDFLEFNASKETIIQPTAHRLLDCISCGTSPINPAESLELASLDNLFAFLRNNYEEIIIDTPPLHLVTDALLISRLADISLYVIRQGYTKIDELSFINDIYLNERLPKLNIVFNGIQRQKYGYGYNYDNSYYHKLVSKTK